MRTEPFDNYHMQPIPKRVMDSNPETAEPAFNTLLLDMNSIMKMSLVDRRLSSDGVDYGMIFQTLLQIKLALRLMQFEYVYAFYDGVQSGIMRYDILPSYKENRNKNFTKRRDDTEYNRSMDAFCAKVMAKSKKTKTDRMSGGETDDERFERERLVVMECLENLYIRNIYEDYVEGDDLIAYYVLHKKKKERCVIVSSDRDLTQLISPTVSVYIPKMKKLITPENHVSEIGYCHENVLLKKIICGDPSDNIKGVKGVGEKTLMDNFPDFRKRAMTIEEIVEGAKKINENREREKKPHLKWADNLAYGVTDGEQGNDLYRINRRLMDLGRPMLTSEAVDTMEAFMYAPMDPEGRSYDNLYKTLCDNGVEELLNEEDFSRFFSDYTSISEKEKKRFLR